MTLDTRIRHALCLSALLAQPLQAEPVVIADLSWQDPGAWRLITDRVMGGLSKGEAVIESGALHLTGDVTTANNGGFVQARLSDVSLPRSAQSLRLTARGDGQTYFIHLRTSLTRAPWHYYRAAFTAPAEWSEITLPLTSFTPSASSLPALHPMDVTTLAVVAYGRDHRADVSVRRILSE